MSDAALVGVEVIVASLQLEKFLVFALLHDAAILNDQDLIGLLDRAQPVGNDEGCPVPHQGLEAFLYEGLALRVQV